MENTGSAKSETWRTVGGDLSDDEWELIADLVAPFWKPGEMGRPIKHDRRAIVNAIFYVTATGCQWRRLPANYPNWSTVHHYHVTWSRDGTWERVGDRLRALVRESEGRDSDPGAGIVDARSVRGAPTVTSVTRGYDAGKKISGRKVFGLVDTIGLLLAVTVVVASMSDNAGGIAVFDKARPKSGRLAKVWVDAGFKKAFATAATTQFGSGWAWLVKGKDKPLAVVKTANQDNPIGEGHTVLLGCDVWEHAYYLKYQNKRADYVNAWYGVVNWEFVAAAFAAAK